MPVSLMVWVFEARLLFSESGAGQSGGDLGLLAHFLRRGWRWDVTRKTDDFGGVGSAGLCGCGAGSGWRGNRRHGAVGWAGGRSRRARRFSPRKPRYKPATRAAAKKIVANGIMSGIKNAFTGFSTVRRGAVFRIRKDCENDTDKAPGAAYGGNEVRLLCRQGTLICCGKSVFPERHSLSG